MIIPIMEYKRIKRRNGIGKIYYKYVIILDSKFKEFVEQEK